MELDDPLDGAGELTLLLFEWTATPPVVSVTPFTNNIEAPRPLSTLAVELRHGGSGGQVEGGGFDGSMANCW